MTAASEGIMQDRHVKIPVKYRVHIVDHADPVTAGRYSRSYRLVEGETSAGGET